MCRLKFSYTRVVESTKRENRFKNILVNVPGLKQYFSVCYIKLLMGCFTFFPLCTDSMSHLENALLLSTHALLGG